MTKTYYESHITMTGDKDTLKKLVEDQGWIFSCIDGDPVMGSGQKCYATMLFNSKMGKDLILCKLLDVADRLKYNGANVLRKKLEQVIYDDRSSLVKCKGGCAECHLDDLCEGKK